MSSEQQTMTHEMQSSRSSFGPQSGLTLVEMMVALVLGLVLTMGLTAVYMTSKTAFFRENQLSAVQQSVRSAFEYLASDLRMVGHFGCYTGNSAAPVQPGITSTELAGNFAIGVTGYEWDNGTSGSYTISSNTPADVADAAKWKTNVGTDVNTIPVTTIGGVKGITPGSDVLVVREVSGSPMRLTAATAAGSLLTIENISGGKCGSGTGKISGFCASSYGLIASCKKARVFPVSSVAAAGSTANVTVGGGGFTAGEYQPGNTEVFPIQTVVYYVKSASNGKTTSLYRRTFDGTVAEGVEQELIEGVENLQVKFGRDNAPAGALDGAVDEYVTADQVTAADWSNIVVVRISLVVRASDAVEKDVPVPSSGMVNGVTVNYPSTGSKYDRRVFTTTVAVRNKIPYF